MENAKRVARHSLASARKCLEEGNYGRAFANYLLFLKLDPLKSHEVYLEFSLATREWCETLERNKKIEELFKCYDQACEFYPSHDTLLNNIGAQLFRLGYIQEAAAYIRRSLLVNPNYLAAHENLENICSHLVERWHFSMLNDKRRNTAYKVAIEKAIKRGYDTVLDIGTGTGILSLICYNSGAHSVSACDSSRAMIEVAEDVMWSNRARVNLIHKPSTALSVPEDIPERVKLVVTEIFDAGLFGEHAVSTLIHAWRHLLSESPMGSVIPCGATMYVCGIESEAIRQQNRLLYPVLQHLDLAGVELLSNTGHVPEEPYTTENLAHLDKGYRLLTNTAELLRVSFCNLFELESLEKGKDWECGLHVKQNGHLDALAVWFDLHLDDSVTIATGADEKSCWEQAIYPVTSLRGQEDRGNESCQVRKSDQLRTVFHFEQDCLRLVSCDLVCEGKASNFSVTSSTEGCKCGTSSGTSLRECKAQVLPFRKRKVEPLTCVVESPDVGMAKVGETGEVGREDVCDSLRNVSLHAEVAPADTGQGQCTNNPTEQSPGITEYHECSCNDTETGKLDRHLGPVYNTVIDTDFKEPGSAISACGKLVESDYSNVGKDKASNKQRKHSTDNLRHLCLTEQSEIVYINDIHLNKQCVEALESYCRQHDSPGLTLIYLTHRLSFLGIQACKMGFETVVMATPREHHSTIRHVAELNGCDSGRLILTEAASLGSLGVMSDIFLCDPVEPYGALAQQVLEDISLHRLVSVQAEGLVLPLTIRMYGVFIESDELENLSHVTGNDNVLGFKISEHINVFQAQNHVNIDLANLKYTKLTDVFEMLTFDLNDISRESSSSFDQSVNINVAVTMPGKIAGLVYWFELKLSEDVSISTIDPRCHWRQAALMMRDVIDEQCSFAEEGETLITTIILQNSCLGIKVESTGCC